MPLARRTLPNGGILLPSLLNGWRSARSGIESSPADIFVIGSSITQGLGVSSGDFGDGWPTLLQDKLEASVGDASRQGRYYAAKGTTGAEDANTWVYTPVGLSQQTTIGLARYGIILAQTSTATKTDVDCTYLTVAWTRGSTSFGGAITIGSFELRVDGVLEGTVNCYDASVPAETSKFHNTTTFGPFSDGLHDIEIKCVSGTLIQFEGVYAHKGNHASGVRVWNGGHAAYAMNTVDSNVVGACAEYQPDLVVVQHTYNDRLVDNVTYRLRARAVMDAFQASDYNGDVLFVTEYQTNSYSVDGRWEDHRIQLRNEAREQGYAYWDMGSLIPELGVPGGAVTDSCGFLGDSHHPSDLGHDWIAEQYSQVLTDSLPTRFHCDGA